MYVCDNAVLSQLPDLARQGNSRVVSLPMNNEILSVVICRVFSHSVNFLLDRQGGCARPARPIVAMPLCFFTVLLKDLINVASAPQMFMK